MKLNDFHEIQKTFEILNIRRGNIISGILRHSGNRNIRKIQVCQKIVDFHEIQEKRDIGKNREGQEFQKFCEIHEKSGVLGHLEKERNSKEQDQGYQDIQENHHMKQMGHSKKSPAHSESSAPHWQIY